MPHARQWRMAMGVGVMLMRHDGIKDAKEINLDRCYEASDRQRAISRRTQALLAAAGMDEPARKWFVITVDNGMDRQLAAELERSGVEVWLPVVMVMPPRRSGMPKKARQPKEQLALKGYLFAKVAATVDAWAGLATAKGFNGMLGSEGRPLPICDDQVSRFKRYFKDDPDAKATVTGALRLGDPIIVKDGPFRSFPGTVETLDEERGRAMVFVNIFGNVNPVHLDIAQIRKL